jgi:hypothetical protein
MTPRRGGAPQESDERAFVTADNCLAQAWPAGTLVSNQPGGGVEMFAIGGTATVKSLDVWRMRSAW